MTDFDINSGDKLDASLRQSIPDDIARDFKVIPCHSNGSKISLYTDESSLQADKLDELEILLGKSVELIPAKTDDIDLLISTYYAGSSSPTQSSNKSVGDPEFLNNLIEETIALNGSDIHIEPYEKEARIRIRVNGHLVERYAIEKSNYPELVNKVKITSHLDIAEKRLPQDGRIMFESETRKFDIRVSILPTHYGEKAVLRLLGSDTSKLNISKLGFNNSEFNIYQSVIQKPNGMVLISGPTGSGKTTTLYATLKELNKEDRNITTIEDPVEYTLKGINQVQLNEKIGLNFSAALRTFLRQDPDVIMVGEIRDLETAQMATRAALTGHLVFSTIHTNSAWGIFNRLIEMGIAPYLVLETLNAGIAQRLIRILCPHCKQESTDLSQIPAELAEGLSSHFTSQGCTHCFGTGFASRRAIYEIIPSDPELSNLISSPRDEVYSYLEDKGLYSLKHNAIKLLKEGETSLSEVMPFLI
ncbi:MAG: type II/IV secretion system protein [Cyclobacteriaceae bacterium]|nr:type II/IV secretion system protein [Cyclobacteriaceae bacterium HetDA_MAG_MS6]